MTTVATRDRACSTSLMNKGDEASKGLPLPLMARNGRRNSACECPFLSVKQTSSRLCQHSISKVKFYDALYDGKLPSRDLWAVIDSVTHRPALVNNVPQIDLDLDDADDLTDLLNRLRSRSLRKS
jgi:hypothetical protein